ncbi:hypothetical protein HYPSUDRAFT_971541 [Hypholoma sublateritium FD-334 SS-4]|uniref:Uncharacterized protein n=1 Tax=Hypholoma sublateritium (strain FD-334 SS-4) TaxID=945553 RepID=A0A0D2NGH9_HYPSF|nr:hypothetical protein HYPSUDRAFT_971541 [Hypholoma sublateritium FD-334 SS-4]
MCISRREDLWPLPICTQEDDVHTRGPLVHPCVYLCTVSPERLSSSQVGGHWRVSILSALRAPCVAPLTHPYTRSYLYSPIHTFLQQPRLGRGQVFPVVIISERALIILAILYSLLWRGDVVLSIGRTWEKAILLRSHSWLR